MLRLILLVTIISFNFTVSGQDKKLVKETVDFIIQTYNVPEANPVHYKESGLIDSTFKTLLLDYFEIKKSGTEYSSSYLFNLLFLNSISEFEDSPDIRRMKMRRSICFSCIALKADLLSAFTFIDYAKYSILDHCPDKIESDLETEYIGLLFFELLINTKRENYQNKNDIQRIKMFLSKNRTLINSRYLDKSEYLTGKYEKLNN
jgi:hypothetical protein